MRTTTTSTAGTSTAAATMDARTESAHPTASAADRAVWAWVAGWAGLVGVALWWGAASISGDLDQGVNAAPVTGHWGWFGSLRLLPAVALGVLAVAYGRRVAERLSWSALRMVTGVTATAWTLALAASKGWGRVGSPLDGSFDFLPFATRIDSPTDFLRTYVASAPDYPIHVQGHPPGATLIFWLIDRAGVTTLGGAAAVVLVAWGVATVAVLVTLGELAGRSYARRAAPFLALAPAAVWAGTSADVLYAAAIAVGVALVAVATGRDGPQAIALAAVGGALLGVGLQLTYGAVPLLLLPAGIVVARRRFALVAPLAAGLALVMVAVGLAGFWWTDGLAFTRAEYWDGIAADRSWRYFLLIGNPAALALAVGPAVAVGLAQVRRSRPASWAPCGLALGGLAAVAAANASGLSKAEVERIWLPFVPWVLTATALIPLHRARHWLAVNVGLGLALEALLRSKW